MDAQNKCMNINRLPALLLSPTQKKTTDFTSFLSQMNYGSSKSSNNKQEYSPYVIKSGCFSCIKPKTINFLTQNKRRINQSKIYTPSPNTEKSQKLSDRFIPMNKGVNLMEKFNLANRYDEEEENQTANECDNNSNINENSMKYNEILKQNVLNENLSSSIFSKNLFSDQNGQSTQSLRSKIFSFKTEGKQKNDFYHSIFLNQKDEMNGIEERKINPKPYKILKAEELSDDFYLNLVDWSARNDIAVGLGNKVQLWSTNQTQTSILCSYQDEVNKLVTSVMWNQDGNLLAVGNSKGCVEVYDINRRQLIETLPGHEARVGVVAWNENIISSGSKDCTILTRDIRCNNNIFNNSYEDQNSLNLNNIIMKHIGHVQEVCGLKWSFDHSQLASGGNDNHLMVWDLHSNRPLMCNSSHSAAVKAIAWSPHQHNMLVSGGGTADRTIRFWNTSTFTQINKIDTGSQVCNLVFSKTVNELVSTHGFSLNQIILWKIPSMTKIATLTGHTFRVLYLGLSPDGQNIVTGAGDQTLRFWNLFPPFKMDSVSCLFPSNKDIR